MDYKIWKTKSGYNIIRLLAGRCNVFLLSNGRTNILIDCSREKYRDRLMNNLARTGINKIEALILTHTHFDHAENAAFIQSHFGSEVIVHQAEALYLEKGASPLAPGTFFPVRPIKKLLAPFLEKRFIYEGCKPQTLINNEYSLNCLGYEAYLLPTPGHSAGMMSLIIDNEIAIVGDAMFGIFPGSVFPPFADNVRQLIASWKLLVDSGCTLFLPSHGSERTRQTVEKNYDRLIK